MADFRITDDNLIVWDGDPSSDDREKAAVALSTKLKGAPQIAAEEGTPEARGKAPKRAERASSALPIEKGTEDA